MAIDAGLYVALSAQTGAGDAARHHRRQHGQRQHGRLPRHRGQVPGSRQRQRRQFDRLRLDGRNLSAGRKRPAARDRQSARFRHPGRRLVRHQHARRPGSDAGRALLDAGERRVGDDSRAIRCWTPAARRSSSTRAPGRPKHRPTARCGRTGVWSAPSACSSSSPAPISPATTTPSIMPDGPLDPLVDRQDVGVVQGFVEDSNVSPVQEIMRLIQVQRAFDDVCRADAPEQQLARRRDQDARLGLTTWAARRQARSPNRRPRSDPDGAAGAREPLPQVRRRRHIDPPRRAGIRGLGDAFQGARPVGHGPARRPRRAQCGTCPSQRRDRPYRQAGRAGGAVRAQRRCRPRRPRLQPRPVRHPSRRRLARPRHRRAGPAGRRQGHARSMATAAAIWAGRPRRSPGSASPPASLPACASSTFSRRSASASAWASSPARASASRRCWPCWRAPMPSTPWLWRWSANAAARCANSWKTRSATRAWPRRSPWSLPATRAR